MGDLELKCSLCCNKTFNSKASLSEHLSTVLANLTCPVCNNKWSSIAHLIEHLNLDDCQPEYSIVQTIQGSDEYVIDGTEGGTTTITIKEKFDNNVKDISDGTIINTVNNEMYVEILSKDDNKTCLQTQELKLLNEDGGMERFVVVTDSEGTPVNLDSAVVTKQNSDGTISLQTVKEMKIDSDGETAITTENEVDDDQEELYSCNTCGVSFSSVIEHIQSYHNDQEVVVAESFEDDENGMPVHYSTLEPEEQLVEKIEAPRRVITDNGDIVDAAEVESILPDGPTLTSVCESEPVEKPTRQQGRRYVQIDKFCDSMVKNISPSNKKSGSCGTHKVVVKEVMHNGNQMKTYYCISCNIYVSHLDEFKNHPCKMLKYPCPHCPVAYENSKSLCAHMRIHKAKTTEPNLPASADFFKCEICNTVFQTNKSLKLHKRMHDPVKSRPIEPPIETPEGNEGSTGRYLCTVCDKLIPVDYRTIHEESHTADDQLNCGICNKKFHSNKYLEMHMSVHNLDKVPVNKTDKSLPYSCLYCNRRFARPHEKVKHERIHTGEKPHSCEICGKSFRVSYCLTLHMRTHTGARPYACPLCGKRFKAHSVYNHHLLTHSEVRRYKCPYCPKAFKTSVQLAGHKNSHTKPFSCEHCNRPFASLYAVRVHTETHLRQNNLKFSCSQCGASYARAFALKDHLKQVHKQDIDSAELNVGSLSKKSVWVIEDGVKRSLREVEVQTADKDAATETRLVKEDWSMEVTEHVEDELQEVELQTLDSKDLTQIEELEMATDQL